MTGISSDNPCPRFEDAPEHIRAEYDNSPPTCCGVWVKGSGGHRIYKGSCENVATWWHPNDMHAHCDEHCPEQDKKWYLEDWSKPWVSRVL